MASRPSTNSLRYHNAANTLQIPASLLIARELRNKPVTRIPCKHGVTLQRGLRCVHGYLEMLLQHKGRTVCKTFGIHTTESQKVAEIYLADVRKEIFLGRFNMALPLKSKTFREASSIWFKLWKEETNDNGAPLHNEDAIYQTNLKLSKLQEYFGAYMFDAIRPIDIENWRKEWIGQGRQGTTLNRYQNVLGSIFNFVDKWIKAEKIKPAFKVPTDINPCKVIDKAETIKRTRILTKYEAGKLRNAFETLNDKDGWEICKMALKSVLSSKDLKNLETGSQIDLIRSKTGVKVKIPIQVLVALNWKNWTARWNAARKTADLEDLQFRDLRKSGINWLKGRHDLKLVSEYAGHADIETTEKFYTVENSEHLGPLAKDLEEQVNSI